MNNNCKLSIIIPIYNGEKFITACIDKILKINLEKEIIAINDGSTDNSLELLKKYGAKLILINLKINRGVSYARNLGIAKASGDYITFIDIDDDFDIDMHGKLLKTLIANGSDLCGCNYDIIETNGRAYSSKYNIDFGTIDQKKAIKYFLIDKIVSSACVYVAKTEFVKNVRFDEKLQIGEDILFILNLLMKVSKISFVDEPLYHYIQNNSSAMHCVSNKILNYLKTPSMLDASKIKYLSVNFQKEFEYFNLEMLQRAIHVLSSLYKYDKKSVIALFRECHDRKKYRMIIKSSFAGKYLKIEFLILYLFGIRIHLLFFPYYELIKRMSRTKHE